MDLPDYNFDPRIRRRHTPLVTHQRRLRQVCGILARNVQLPFECQSPKIYYTLHQSPSLDAFYVSEALDNIENPTWKQDLRSIKLVNPSSKNVTIRICVTSLTFGDRDRCICEWEVHFSGLVYVSQQVPRIGRAFRPNTLLIATIDGIYGLDGSCLMADQGRLMLGGGGTDSEDVEEEVGIIATEDMSYHSVPTRQSAVSLLTGDFTAQRRTGSDFSARSGDSSSTDGSLIGGASAAAAPAPLVVLTMYTEESALRRSYQATDLDRIRTSELAIHQTQGGAQRIKTTIESRLKQREERLWERFSRRERLRLQVSMLRNQLSIAQKDLDGDLKMRDDLQNDLKNEQKRQEENAEKLNKCRDVLIANRTVYLEKRESLKRIYARLLYQRKHLISELSTYIYPIQPIVTKENRGKGFSICSAFLPNSQDIPRSSSPMDTPLSIALGYVAHSCVMLAHFLDVPLRYPIAFSMPHPTIQNPLPDEFREFPLMVPKTDRHYFDFGVFLLNKNISQLRCHCGIPTKELSHTLSNLKGLFDHFSESKPRHQLIDNLSSTMIPEAHSTKESSTTNGDTSSNANQSDAPDGMTSSNHDLETVTSRVTSSESVVAAAARQQTMFISSTGAVQKTPVSATGHKNSSSTISSGFLTLEPAALMAMDSSLNGGSGGTLRKSHSAIDQDHENYVVLHRS